MSIDINFDSFKALNNGTNQAMVFGWKSCKYGEVADALELKGAKIFDYRLGNKSIPINQKKTLEGRLITQLDFDSQSETVNIARTCKTAINNLILENYKRKQENLPVISLIFCFDIDGKTRQVTPQSIAAKEANKIITNCELRRCYKICCEIAEDSSLAPLAKVANESLKFVKLAKSPNGKYNLELLSPFWKTKEWESAWKLRKEAATSQVDKTKILWRDQLKWQLASLNQKSNVSKKRHIDELNGEFYLDNSSKKIKLAGDFSQFSENSEVIDYDDPHVLIEGRWEKSVIDSPEDEIIDYDDPHVLIEGRWEKSVTDSPKDEIIDYDDPNFLIEGWWDIEDLKK